jgi:hypothetical protein
MIVVMVDSGVGQMGKLQDSDESWAGSTKGTRSKAPDLERLHLESLFELEGLGREMWEGIDPDEYVCELRAGWD